MNFDLRLPIGIMFSFYGVVLVLYGLLGDKAQYARSLGININLIWGIVLLVFGALMLMLAVKRKPSQSNGERKQ
jgi:high-affinity Fe2+/Pb2+ permease